MAFLKHGGAYAVEGLTEPPRIRPDNRSRPYREPERSGLVLPPRPAWHDDAACRDLPTEMFFHAVGESVEPALRVCRACPVRSECLEDNLTQRYGVFGGMSGRQRKLERKRRGLADE